MNQSFYSLEKFPEISAIVDSWGVIRDEFLALEAPVMDIHRFGKEFEEVTQEIMNKMMNGEEYGWVKGWSDTGENEDWVQYGLQFKGLPAPAAFASMPKTMGLLSGMKGIKVCALAKMYPNAYLPLHRHPEIDDEGLLQFHLTIDAPEERNFAYLNVNNEFRQHKMGEGFIFDGSLDHFAINASEQSRTILYIEFEKREHVCE